MDAVCHAHSLARLWLRFILVLVCYDLDELNLLVYSYSHLFQHRLDFHFNVFVFEGVGIDDREIFLHDGIRLVVLFNVAVCLRDRQYDA